MRLPVRLLGLLFLIVGTVGFALMLAGAGAATKTLPIEVLTTGPFPWILAAVGSLIAIISPVHLVVGTGLLRQASWARPLAFAVAMMSVFSFPVGTLLALVTFGVLHLSEAKRLFETASGSAPPIRESGTAAATDAQAPAVPLAHADRAVPPSALPQTAPAAVVSVAYHVELDDLVAFAEYHTAHSPTVRRDYYWSLGVGALTVLVLLWILGFRSAGGWAGGVVALVGWVVYFNWRTVTGNRRHYRRVYGEGANRGMLGPHRASADAEGLTVSTSVTDSRTRWSGVERIEEASGLALIYVSALSANVIPEARVVEGNFREFVQTIRRLHADASHEP